MIKKNPEIGPFFVLGSTRSGTTAVAAALADATGYRAMGEGHIWPLLLHLEDLVARYSRGVMASRGANSDLEMIKFVDDLRRFGLLDLFRDHYSNVGNEWIDKTPGTEMIRMAPRLLSVYPNARFILMKRHPVDAVQSKMRRFPNINLQAHAAEWAEAYQAWIDIRDKLGNSFIEIDQFDLHRDPEFVASLIADIVGRDEDFANCMSQHYMNNRSTEQTKITGTSAVISLADTDWSRIDRADFIELCQDTAEDMGYDISCSTVIGRASDAISLFFPQIDTRHAFCGNRNEFSYSIKGGLQLCPNYQDQDDLTISYRSIPIDRPRRLRFSYRREFSFGGNVRLIIEARRSDNGDLILLKAIDIDHTSIESADFALEITHSVIDIDFRIIIPNSGNPDYKTVIIYRPIII